VAVRTVDDAGDDRAALDQVQDLLAQPGSVRTWHGTLPGAGSTTLVGVYDNVSALERTGLGEMHLLGGDMADAIAVPDFGDGF
jgi:hypothetical protein